MPIKVLVVEDDYHAQQMISAGLGRLQEVQAILAGTIDEARMLLQIHPDTFIIAIDGCVPGDELNTLPLIREIVKSGFKGELIAISSDPWYRDEMRLAGCRHECKKSWLSKLVADLLQRIRTASPPPVA